MESQIWFQFWFFKNWDPNPVWFQFQTQFQKSDPVLVQFLLITTRIGGSNMPKSSTWPTIVYTLPYTTQHSAIDPLPGPNLNESIEEGPTMGAFRIWDFWS